MSEPEGEVGLQHLAILSSQKRLRAKIRISEAEAASKVVGAFETQQVVQTRTAVGMYIVLLLALSSFGPYFVENVKLPGTELNYVPQWAFGVLGLAFALFAAFALSSAHFIAYAELRKARANLVLMFDYTKRALNAFRNINTSVREEVNKLIVHRDKLVLPLMQIAALRLMAPAEIYAENVKTLKRIIDDDIDFDFPEAISIRSFLDYLYNTGAEHPQPILSARDEWQAAKQSFRKITQPSLDRSALDHIIAIGALEKELKPFADYVLSIFKEAEQYIDGVATSLTAGADLLEAWEDSTLKQPPTKDIETEEDFIKLMEKWCAEHEPKFTILKNQHLSFTELELFLNRAIRLPIAPEVYEDISKKLDAMQKEEQAPLEFMQLFQGLASAILVLALVVTSIYTICGR